MMLHSPLPALDIVSAEVTPSNLWMQAENYIKAERCLLGFACRLEHAALGDRPGLQAIALGLLALDMV